MIYALIRKAFVNTTFVCVVDVKVSNSACTIICFHPAMATLVPPLCLLCVEGCIALLVLDCAEETAEGERETDLGHPHGWWVELAEDARIFRMLGRSNYPDSVGVI